MTKGGAKYGPGQNPNSLANLIPKQPGDKPKGYNASPSKGRLRSLADMLARFGVKEADAKTMLEMLVTVAKTGDLKALEMLLSLDKRLNPDMSDELDLTPLHVQTAEAALRELATKLARMRNPSAAAPPGEAPEGGSDA